MKLKVNLHGEWKFLLSNEKPADDAVCNDSIILPSTVQQMKKSPVTDERSAGYLTDPHRFDGYAVYERELDIPYDDDADVIFTAERTRVTALYIDGRYVGTQNSLCSPHRYDITDFVKDGKFRLRLLVDNVSYPVPGGHLTSQDTQTNWLGVLGEISISYRAKKRFENVRFFADPENSCVKVCGKLKGCDRLDISAETGGYGKRDFTVTAEEPFFVFEMPEAKQWNEHEPYVYTMKITANGDTEEYTFGMRKFETQGCDFTLNGRKIHLRGKHDGMIFPMTAAAPTDVEGWKKVLSVSKEHGINHYRFHTCCPPEAAFTAADELGIYMQPELQFWGTVEEEMNDAQHYLVEEGYRMLDEYGNHPSFFALSLGNELWGSAPRLNEILGGYKKHDPRPLYTQGSNNFQFWPSIVENDDFFSGVRFSRDRLFRGSYAMCDAPLGHIQTDAPDSSYTFDEHIRPEHLSGAQSGEGGTIEIQYGTGVKKVSLTNSNGELIPQIPVVSHEVGQYFMYPDYNEIEKYTGVLKPYNLEIFRECLEEAGLADYADRYFKASGRFAAECYKFEIETALRSKELAGFQLLDIQDFTGQGTALVGILNSFMESKGVISPEEWRGFCSERVILGCLDGFVYKSGEKVKLGVKLYSYTDKNENDPDVKISLGDKEYILNTKCNGANGLFDLGEIEIEMPLTDKAEKIRLTLECADVSNGYDLWIFPEIKPEYGSVVLAKEWGTAAAELEKGSSVLFMPESAADEKYIEGTYCTDFWNYPMFSSISKSMNKPVPTGTLGLLIEKEHPVFEKFPTEIYSTAQWYDIVTDSNAVILDKTGLAPFVRTIDNCERNHSLGTVFEAAVGSGKLVVCTAKLDKKKDSLPSVQLLAGILDYMNSDKFAPSQNADTGTLAEIFA